MKTEMLTIAGLLSITGVTYAELSEESLVHIEEAGHVANIMQTNQLDVALELYYQDNNSYPDVLDDDLIDELYNQRYLKNNNVRSAVTYNMIRDGKDYELFLQ